MHINRISTRERLSLQHEFKKKNPIMHYSVYTACGYMHHWTYAATGSSDYGKNIWG